MPAMAEFADDTSTELERRARALSVLCIVETVSYAILATFWIMGNTIGVRVFGTAHGVVFLGFAAMVIMIYRPMEWNWKFAVFAFVTGPVGAIAVFEVIRRHGVPESKRRAAMPPQPGRTAANN
jgi:multisubunit Na+/H+ antiporter MnhG subunit